MLNPFLLRHELSFLAQQLFKKGFQLDTEKVLFMEEERKKLQIKTENLQHRQNLLSKLIGKSKLIEKNTELLKKEVIKLNVDLNIFKNKLNILKEDIHTFYMSIPNIPDNEIPEGDTEKHNKIIKFWGEKKQYDFSVQDHVKIGQKYNFLDWKSSSNISGSRFVIMKDQIALLHRALGQFMLDLHTKKHGYIETYVPYLVKNHALYGTGQLPKFSDDLFHIHTTSKNDYVLIPTAEVPLTNLFTKTIIHEKQLPIMLTAKTPCFRSEASSYGKDTKGLIRLHQFDKVELVQIVQPEKSMLALEILTNHAEKVLQLLELPYRKVLLCTGELGFSASKTYDLEVWFPSQNTYREVSSCSNMNDFQTRRMKTRYRSQNSKKINFLHTLNGSGLAIGRTLAAILENYQCADGRIEIPKILQKKYMQNLEFIN